MYPQYRYIFGGCDVSNAYTDSTRFPCISLAVQPTVRRSIYSSEASTPDIKCEHDTCKKQTPASCRYGGGGNGGGGNGGGSGRGRRIIEKFEMPYTHRENVPTTTTKSINTSISKVL